MEINTYLQNVIGSLQNTNNCPPEDPKLLRCQLCKYLPMFYMTIVPSSSGSCSSGRMEYLNLFLDYLTLKIKGLQSFRTSVNTYQSTQCIIPEDLNLQQHHWENLTLCNCPSSSMLYTILFHFSVVEVLQLVHEVTDFKWLDLSCDTENNSAGQEVPLHPPPRIWRFITMFTIACYLT